MKKTKKNNINNNSNSRNSHKSCNTLRGGKFIDKGGFGCVLSPALPCTTFDNNLNNSISKIVKHESDTLKRELAISEQLKNLDPGHKFYITIDKYCFINDIPKNRTDLVNVIYKDEKLKHLSIDTTDKYNKGKKIDKHYCDIDIDMKPMNLIMPYAGISLSSVMKSERKRKGFKAEMHQMFVDDLKIYFKHLIIGLLKMHNNRIVNKDIKQKNIMLFWKDDRKYDKRTQKTNDDKSTNTNPIEKKNEKANEKPNEKPNEKANDIMSIRYIDFGLSEFLTSEICKDISNISLQGTPYYLSPEIFICYVIRKYDNYSEQKQLHKIMDYISKNIKKAFSRIGEKSIVNNIDNNISNIYMKIKNMYNMYNKNRILNVYFGSDNNKFNGYLQKADVYALGLSIYDTLYRYSEINVKKNEALHSLLLNMIELDPDKRYNIVQCLGHSYFTEKNKKI